MPNDQLTAEAEIRRLPDSWIEAIHARDIDRILSHHSADMVMFDVPGPLQLRGLSAYRQSWDLFFRHFPESGGVFEIAEMQIIAADSLAFAYGVLRCRDR